MHKRRCHRLLIFTSILAQCVEDEQSTPDIIHGQYQPRPTVAATIHDQYQPRPTEAATIHGQYQPRPTVHYEPTSVHKTKNPISPKLPQMG